MPAARLDSPMRIRLTDERRELLLRSIKQYYAEELDEEISDFRAGELLDFFVRELGPPVYNQAVQDVLAFLQEKLSDLEGDLYEPEEPYAR
jgi:uncharacterized protein (DUF2164 family)